MRTRAFWAAVAALSLAACHGTAEESNELPPLTGCTSPGPVWILDVGFAPPCITVAAGAAVRFQNLDAVDHTVTGYTEQGALFDSHLLVPGQEFTYTFATPAIVQLRCSLHPSTIGEVIVQ